MISFNNAYVWYLYIVDLLSTLMISYNSFMSNQNQMLKISPEWTVKMSKQSESDQTNKEYVKQLFWNVQIYNFNTNTRCIILLLILQLFLCSYFFTHNSSLNPLTILKWWSHKNIIKWNSTKYPKCNVELIAVMSIKQTKWTFLVALINCLR